MKERLLYTRAIVTGAAGGIGQAVSRALAAQGCSLLLCDRERETLAQLAGELRAAGAPCCEAITVDLMEHTAAQTILDAAEAAFGVPDVLFNNAGVAYKENVLDITQAHWDETIRVNLTASFFLSQETMKRMQPHRHGYILHTLSNVVAPDFDLSLADHASYCISKIGMDGAMRALYEEGRRHGIKVSALMPGYVRTPMLMKEDHASDPTRLHLLPEDIAACVLFLLRTPKRMWIRDLRLENGVPDMDSER